LFPKKQFSEDALISVIFATFEKHFLMIIPKKKDQRVIHEPVFVTHDWQLEGNIPSFS